MESVKAGSKRLIREINEAIVLDAVRTHGYRSRADIALDTGLSAPTVSGITADLIERNLLYEHSTGESAGGRRPVMLALNAGAGCAIGIKVTETAVVAVLTDLAATVLHRRRRRLTATDVDHVVKLISSIVDDLRSKVPDRPVYGLGVGTAGVIDSARGIVHHGTYAHWRDVPLGDLLAQRTGLPTIVENDVNALAVSEHWFGLGRGVADMLVVSLGRGIGLGLILDGRLYRGASGGAGEFGHVKIGDDDTPCVCGSSGCLEAIIGDPAIERTLRQVHGRPITAGDAADAARHGDDALRAVFADAAAVLGRALANLVNTLNPELIVLSGEGSHAADLMVPGVREALRRHTFDGLLDTVDVAVEPWDDEAWARGAASLVLAELFQPALRPHSGTERPTLALTHDG
ncbi:MAG: ROK family protein [Acidimicrobiia bacterium]